MSTPAFSNGDVFHFRYSELERSKRFMPEHCFDGQLVYDGKSGELFDTYWGFMSLSDSGHHFTPEEAAAKGTLTFICNLDEVQPIQECLYEQYDEADRFDLSYQHACYKKYFIRKGAKKSRAMQLRLLDERQQQAVCDKEHAQRVIERCIEDRARLEAGVDVYL